MDPILAHMGHQLAEHGYESEADSVKDEEDFVFVWEGFR